jgi:hypothetical protein
MALEKVFSFRPDWHQDNRANPLVRQYRTELESVLEAHPRLRPCLKRCAHCGIEFLTDPRNVGRTDLRCPFGCRLHHGRRCSTERSTAYYRTASGRRKKKRLNGRRSSRPPAVAPADGPTVDPPVPRIPPPPSAELDEDSDHALRLEGVVLRASSLSKSPLLPYARMLVRLIDGIEWDPREFLELLREAVRQRGFARRNRRDYVLSFLHQHPP